MFSNYVMAGYPLLWVQTYEEYRALVTFVSQLSKSKEPYGTYTYDCVDGIRKISIANGVLQTGNPIQIPKPQQENSLFAGMPGPQNTKVTPLDALEWLEKHASDNTVLFLKDYHHYMAIPEINRKIRNLVPLFKSCGKVLTVISPLVKIPDEIEKEISVIEFELPTREELKTVLKGICESAGAAYPKGDEELVIDASLGMTAFEAENAYSVSLIEKKKFDPEVIRREKASIVKKTGILEVIETKDDLDVLGGVEVLKEWLESRKNTFTSKAREEGVDPARGLMLVGLPGTGKSLTSKVVAVMWGRPCLRLDMGRIKDKYVGESEGRIRHVLRMAETIAPCVLWIDEIEKSFSGSGGGESHEVTKSILQTLLTWMEEHTADVFVVATANAANTIPEELLDRFEQSFWVDLPDAVQRAEILNIHLKKKGKDPKEFSSKMKELVGASKGFNGRGIRKWVAEALVYALNKGHKLTADDLLKTAPKIKPFRETEGIKERRQWALQQQIENASEEHDETEIEIPGPDLKKTNRKIQV